MLLRVILAVLLVSACAWYLNRPRRVPSLPALTVRPAAIATTEPAAPALPTQRDQIRAVYDSEILPLLAAFDHRNQLAADRAIATLHEHVNAHRAGIKLFCRDISSWGTRFGVIGRYTADAWRSVRSKPSIGSVKQYVDGKFRDHILSEQSLQHDLSAAVRQFNEDMAASRNQLYAELRLPLEKIKAPVVATEGDFERFTADVSAQAANLARGTAPDTLVAGLASVVAGQVAFEVAANLTKQIVAQVIARVGTQLAVEGIEAGGATVGGAAAGGGGGSFAGPAGTIIGFGVGLAAGAVIDWWLSDRFEARVSQQCNQFLTALDDSVTHGGGAAGGPGLQKSFNQVVQLAGQAQRKAILSVLTENVQ